MTPNETIAILRKLARACRTDEYLWGTSLPGVPTEVGAAVESAIEMIERSAKTEQALKAMTKVYKSIPYAQWPPEMHLVNEVLEKSK